MNVDQAIGHPYFDGIRQPNYSNTINSAAASAATGNVNQLEEKNEAASKTNVNNNGKVINGKNNLENNEKLGNTLNNNSTQPLLNITNS